MEFNGFSEVFISDNGSNLFSMDLRNGKIAYGYKGRPFFLTPDPHILTRR